MGDTKRFKVGLNKGIYIERERENCHCSVFRNVYKLNGKIWIFRVVLEYLLLLNYYWILSTSLKMPFCA